MNQSPEIPSSQEPLEAPEAERKSPILIVYRDNDLFHEWVPKISGMLQDMDRQVESHAFPAGTTEPEIKDWAKNNRDQIEGKAVVTDYTCSVITWDRFWKEAGGEINLPQKEGGYLDELFWNSTHVAVLGPDWEERMSESEEVGQIFVGIVSRILENKENSPERVTILTPQMRDHEPFSIQPWVQEALGREDRLGKDERSPEDTRKLDEAAVTEVKGWLGKAGISEDAIQVISDVSRDAVRELDRKKSWIVYDRHFKGMTAPKLGIDMERLNQAVHLPLPPANMLEDADKQGLLKLRPGEREKIVAEILRKDFGRQES